ncbi:MAG: tRNA uridine-5-carboxymethylaminomethyl(34) synthesis GTPase MnmE [Oscillospiraceae bacterium]|nr:tRNA uridine-5-carboxymethylaminomethyl(34) synthesis GTPase MnmE [Oscillospiraceae bacterium]
MRLDDTIAAISTSRAVGGISVIRISGSRAFDIADMIFTPVSAKILPSEMDGYTCAYGYYSDGEGNKIDDGVLTVFRCPKSYTGEDCVEASCHGGIYVTEKLLRRIYEAGAVPAEGGEFTKRAFLNGKMSLTQAEGVMDIISADGEAYHRCAEALRDGRLYGRIRGVSDRLVHLLGEIAAWVDYPEEDIPEVGDDNIIAELSDILDEIRRIQSTYDYGKIIREGIDTVICGKPNVGKSTIMNLLTGCERSIVTSAAGTTRDIVEESVRLGDMVLRLSDTAGIREASDEVEKIGVQRAESKLDSSRLILAVFDNSRPFDDDDMKIFDKCRGRKNVIAIINKCDEENRLDVKKITSQFDNVINISAKDGNSISVIQNVINDIFIDNSITDNAIIANERQKLCIDKAEKCVAEAISALKFGDTLDAVNIILDEGENHLLELTGERTSEAVVNEVFSHFCVGK